jgi:hypothetical protein
MAELSASKTRGKNIKRQKVGQAEIYRNLS